MNRLKKNADAMKKMGFPEKISNLKCLKRIHSEDGTTVLAELTKNRKASFSIEVKSDDADFFRERDVIGMPT